MFKNEIFISGKAQRDAERKGNGPYRFTIMQGGGRKKDSDERWPREYFDCVCWPDVEGAESVKANQVVYVEGRLRHREWEDSAGQKKRGYSIQCTVVRPHEDEPKPKPLTPQSYSGLEITDKDIPF